MEQSLWSLQQQDNKKIVSDYVIERYGVDSSIKEHRIEFSEVQNEIFVFKVK